MQYCIINNDIALLMHYRALLQMPDWEFTFFSTPYSTFLAHMMILTTRP